MLRSLRPLSALLLALLFAAAGCNGDKKDPAAGEPKSAEAQKPDANAPKAQDPSGSSTLTLPDALKNDAYEYYGLENSGAVKFKVENPVDPTQTEGSQTLRLISVGEKDATYSVEFGGALLIKGDQEMVLKKDGIWATKMAGKTLEKPVLELPSPVEPGKRWSSSVTLDGADGKPVKIDATFKVVGIEKVKVGGKDYEALRVDGVMSAKSESQSAKSTVSGWYVKGTGQVKFTVKGVGGDPKKTMNVEIAQ